MRSEQSEREPRHRFVELSVRIDRAGDVGFANRTVSFVPVLGHSGLGTDPNGPYEILHLDTGQAEFARTVRSPLDRHELLLLATGDRVLITCPITAGVDLTGL